MAPVRIYKYAVVALVALILATPAAAWSLSDRNDSLVLLYNELGVINALSDEFDMARTYFDSALALRRDDPAVLNNLGNYFLCGGQIDSAIHMYRRAESLDTSDQSRLFNWAVALYMSGETDSSVAMMERFLESVTDPAKMRQLTAVIADEIYTDKASSGSIGQAEFKRLIEKAREKRRMSLQRNRDTLALQTEEPINPSDSTEESTLKKRVIPAAAKHDEYKSLATILFWVF
jgi:tetratricopeptide (TPR) repeat protein